MKTLAAVLLATVAIGAAPSAYADDPVPPPPVSGHVIPQV